MKKIITIIGLSLLTNAFALDYVSSTNSIKHQNEIKTVCGPVGQVTDSQKATFINFDKRYPNQTFYTVIWKSNYKHNEIREMLIPMINDGEDQNICIEGRIQMYKGVPNITIDDIEQIIED